MQEIISPPAGGPLDPSWTEPLAIVAGAIVGDRRYRFFDGNDFMLMGRRLRGRRPSIVLYKHCWTRRYLNLDDEGRAYRYIPPKNLESKGSGRYVAHRDLRTALDHLDLWELPWMKPGLEHHQRGLSWEESWKLHPDIEDEHRPREVRRGHLRLV